MEETCTNAASLWEKTDGQRLMRIANDYDRVADRAADLFPSFGHLKVRSKVYLVISRLRPAFFRSYALMRKRPPRGHAEVANLGEGLLPSLGFCAWGVIWELGFDSRG